MITINDVVNEYGVVARIHAESVFVFYWMVDWLTQIINSMCVSVLISYF